MECWEDISVRLCGWINGAYAVKRATGQYDL